MIKQGMLIVLNADASVWAERYGIEAFEQPCKCCGKLMMTSIPFAFQEYRGLIAPSCELCGSEDTPYCFVRDPKRGSFFKDAEVQISIERAFARKERQQRRHLRPLCN